MALVVVGLSDTRSGFPDFFKIVGHMIRALIKAATTRVRPLSGTSLTPGKANEVHNMWYFRMLESYPLRTKMASAFFIFGSADLTSQIYEKTETYGASCMLQV